ncbi:MAG TPA: glycosyltransferase, partial [Burkholderiaceae bacterium]|nr:glycosyltransferase [Burkholderiaceae bacterium]
MRIVIFCHSLISDWNHGNAHFLRGVATELLARGHTVHVYEPRDAWSVRNLVAEHGRAPLQRFARRFPMLRSRRYDPRRLDLDAALRGADLVLVHEWNDPELVRRIGEHRRAGGSYRLLFHDTHHRSVTDRAAMAAFDLRHYDGVLAFGRIIRDLYLREGWTERAWTWHE